VISVTAKNNIVNQKPAAPMANTPSPKDKLKIKTKIGMTPHSSGSSSLSVVPMSSVIHLRR
jgi:hypothetical protein